MTATRRAGGGRDAAERWCWIGLVGITAIAAARCMIVFVPERYFDVDPSFHGAPLACMGLSGSLALDVVLLLSCAIGLYGEARSGRGVDPLLLGLAITPLPVALAHGLVDAGDLWRGSTWAAAVIAAAAAAHLARDPLRRAVCLGVLLGVLVPLLARGALQMTVEHADTVAAFEQTREPFFAGRGWEPDSAAALIYERRLRQPQPRGWFATSNVLASTMAFGLTAALGLCIAAWRTRRPSGWTGSVGLLALAAAVALWFTGSKGGLGAAMIGVLLVGAAAIRGETGVWLEGRRGLIVPLLLVAVLGAVVTRGTVLPERFLGELSLLFRWHYLRGAAAMLPEALPWGIGPDQFQTLYAVFRPTRSPEEVISAHSMFVDWVVTLGVAALAWVAFVLVSLRRCVTPPLSSASKTGVLWPVLVAAAVAVGLGAWTEATTLDPLTGVVRAVGGLGFVAVALVVAAIVREVTPVAVSWVVTAGVAALLVHGQIEMTFFSPSAVVWSMTAVGLAASPAVRPAVAGGLASSRVGMIAALIVVAAGAWIAVTGLLPSVRQQRLIRDAAAELYPLDADPMAAVRQRERAIGLLEEASEAWPANWRPRLAAADQATAAGASGTARDADMLELAVELGRQAAVVDHQSTAAAVAVANAARLLALRKDTPVYWEEAEDAARLVIDRDPHAIGSWTRLADVLWESGRRDDAVDAYRRALARSDDLELDPLKQLSARRRKLIEERIAEAVGATE